MSETCTHNVMHWARCLECEVDMLNSELAIIRARAVTVEAEVVRLNKWADGMTDIALKERATGEAYQRELRAQLADAIAFVRKAGHLPGCAAGANSCQFSAGEHEMKCGAIKGAWWHNRGHTHFGHDFQPGPCTCGHDRIVGSAGA